MDDYPSNRTDLDFWTTTQAVAVVQSSLVFYACSRGFGTSILLLKDGRLNQIQAVSVRNFTAHFRNTRLSI